MPYSKTFSQADFDRIFTEGATAFDEGRSLTDNPYPKPWFYFLRNRYGFYHYWKWGFERNQAYRTHVQMSQTLDDLKRLKSLIKKRTS